MGADLDQYKDQNIADNANEEQDAKAGCLYFYKLPIALLVFAALGIVLASPFLKDHRVMYILAAAVAMSCIGSAGQLLRMVSCVCKFQKKLLSQEDLEADVESGGLLSGKPRLSHAFIIPNYKEDMSTLKQTLDMLASHRYAIYYTIVLAMEAKEAEAEEKASQLQTQYKGRFKTVLYTMHTLGIEEMPGKASNVNAAVRQFYHIADSPKDAYMLTICDADALIPFQYVQQLEAAAQAATTPGVYAAPVLFEQNAKDTPALVRVTDYTWSALAFQNLNSWFGIGFPISNYSLPLQLAHDIGYWDTFPDAIGEDMHMFIKAFYRTQGACQLYPIFAPINMSHVSGSSYMGSIWARFLQAERHMRGMADTAYALQQYQYCPFSLRKVVMILACLEAHLLPVVTFTALVVLPCYWKGMATLLGITSMPQELVVVDYLGKANLSLLIAIMACYEYIRWAARKHLFRLNEPAFPSLYRFVVHVVSYIWLLVSIWIYALLPILLVAFKHLFNVTSTQYIVAGKKVVASK